MSSTTNGQWYPPEWPGRIRALANGELTPAEPRRASTVLLLRDTGTGGPAVHMLRRRTSMAFAGGAYAYPGGAVDPRDERPVAWAGPSRAQWAVRMGVDPATAQAIVCAAVRETFEEAGVLLAGESADTVVADTTGEDWEADRAALVAHELSFADFLSRRGLVLRSDLLAAWARWITPEFEPRRYDTWFFVAALPEGQHTLPQGLPVGPGGNAVAAGEADLALWTRPGEAAAGYDRGELLMMPPTIATLRALEPYATVADVLAAAEAQDLTPVLARARLVGGEIVLSWPGHDEFTKHIAPGGGAGDGAAEGGSATGGSVAHGATEAGGDSDGPSGAQRATGVPGATGTPGVTGTSGGTPT
ncbi:NUDIX hydrolase [Streptomyces endophytica]|uniref:NUDIX hydrolase n=1 Tax=Streptomyces endophytica TaxID=2991496 RepID=A0ABY6P8X4_9ACTN|nr:NUDIX hydrolase [Streptomyces endophytica]UZJ30270.1 NUDIX hydrolase [Streptomyces endophytica]